MPYRELDPCLCMERPMSIPIPECPLPPGYRIRPLEWDPDHQEEGRLWERTMESSYEEPYPPGDFFNIMVMNFDYWPGRVFLLFDDTGEACGTATSWRMHYRWKDSGIGYVLFVGIAKAWQGRGLAKPLVARLLEDFKENGFHTALLETDDHRLPAVKTYLGLGFTPRIVHENQHERWANIFMALKMDPVAFDPTLRAPEVVPHPPRPYPYEKAWVEAGGKWPGG